METMEMIETPNSGSGTLVVMEEMRRHLRSGSSVVPALHQGDPQNIARAVAALVQDGEMRELGTTTIGRKRVPVYGPAR